MSKCLRKSLLFVVLLILVQGDREECMSYNTVEYSVQSTEAVIFAYYGVFYGVLEGVSLNP